MNAEKRIYFIKPRRYNMTEEVYAVFDSKEKAQRFAYYISLGQTGSIPRDIFKCDVICEVKDIKNEEHNICFYGGAELHSGLFISKVFASTEEQALKKAIRIRNEAVLSGEWDLAWERHKLQQSGWRKKL